MPRRPFDEATFMRYDDFFAEALVPLLHERRYRVFAEIERIAGRFPSGIWHRLRAREKL